MSDDTALQRQIERVLANALDTEFMARRRDHADLARIAARAAAEAGPAGLTVVADELRDRGAAAINAGRAAIALSRKIRQRAKGRT
jgi:hypothetical protein